MTSCAADPVVGQWLVHFSDRFNSRRKRLAVAASARSRSLVRCSQGPLHFGKELCVCDPHSELLSGVHI